ncbi:hypothetical protein D3C85_1658480 [compost metagenome]
MNTAWAASTAVVAGERRTWASNVYYCTTSGTTGTVQPGGAGADGTAAWGLLGVRAAFNLMLN